MLEQLSIIIPVYNEVESLLALHPALHTIMDHLEYPWEVVYVDDGSVDGSQQQLLQLASDDPQHTCAVLLRRNFGQTAAISAGLDYARGDIIVLMDADLQNDPADIPRLLEKLSEGNDVVSGWRAERHDAFATRILPSRIANWLISRVTGVRLHDYGCTLKAYRREVITGFHLYGEMHRFIPAYAVAVGAKIVEAPVRHHARKFGKSKYGLGRTFRVLIDLLTVRYLTKYATKPGHFAGKVGIGLLLMSVLALFGSAYSAVLGKDLLVTLLCLILTSSLGGTGLLCVLMGLLAELLMRTYHEAQNKPAYTVQRVIQRTESYDGIIVPQHESASSSLRK